MCVFFCVVYNGVFLCVTVVVSRSNFECLLRSETVCVGGCVILELYIDALVGFLIEGVG